MNARIDSGKMAIDAISGGMKEKALKAMMQASGKMREAMINMCMSAYEEGRDDELKDRFDTERFEREVERFMKKHFDPVFKDMKNGGNNELT